VSKRKDRERFLAQKQSNPDYVGFRGRIAGSGVIPDTRLESITCSKCGRKRNVAAGIALEHSGDYVCSTCQEDLQTEPSDQDSINQ
jgi:DNA-directed RNA polymerase subunit RPC12/RpoP